MLLSYAFTNFQSFRERTEVSFRLDNKAPQTAWSSNIKSVGRVAKVMSVIGPNASGKTALVKPVAFLAWFIAGSFLSSPGSPIPIRPHFLPPKKPTEFEVDIESEGKLWRYVLRVTPDKVLHEALYVKHERFKYVFVRDWDEKSHSYIIKQQDFGFAAAEARKVRPNASLISTAAQYGVPRAIELTKIRISTNVNAWGRQSISERRINEAIDYFGDNDHHRIDMSRLLSSWDLGLSGVELKEVIQDNPQGAHLKQWHPFGIHLVRGKRHELDFIHESSGTRGAFALLALLLPALEEGGIAVIDEFENDLHPHMLSPILDLFANPKTNKKNAQLLFTCHALEVLNTLPKAHVYLVEKNADCESNAWRLDTLEGIRNDDNFYAKYMAGAYGAIPNI